MFLYFDKYYRLKEIVQDENFVQGGYNNNQLFVYIEGEPYFTNATIRYELHGVSIDDRNTPMTTDEYEFNKMSGKMQIPFNRNRDLKYFSYHNSYDFLVFNLTDTENNLYNILAVDGLVLAMIRLYDSDTNKIQPLGVITFKVEKGIVAKDSCITSSQFDTLMLNIASKQEILKSGENIKTIEGQDVLGSGDIDFSNKYDTIENVNSKMIDIFNNSKNYTNSEVEKTNKNVYSNQRRIEQLEKASEGTILETIEDDTQVSYVRQIEEGTLPYALLEKIGGMTYKSENLIILEDKEAKTVNGVTYSIKDGVITLNGTATKGFNIYEIPLKVNGESFYVMPFGMVTTSNLFAMAIATSDWSIGRVFNYNNYVDGSVINAWKPEIMQIQIINGAVFNNVEFKPMMVSGTTAPTEFTQGFVGLRNSAVNEVVNNGANLFDINNLEIGSIGTDTGKVFDEVSRLRNIDFINVIKGNTYCFTILDTIYTFKSILLYNNGNFVRADSAFTNKTNVIYEIPNNVNQIKLIIARKDNATITTFNDLQCMLVYGSTIPTEFKPYIAPTIKTIPTAIQALEGYDLGLPKVENCYNYVDFENKKFVQKVMEVDLEKLEIYNFQLRTDPYVYAQVDFNLSELADMTSNRLLSISDKLTVDSRNIWTLEGMENTFVFLNNSRIRVLFNGTTYTTKEQIQAYLKENSIKIVYLLETPTETDISNLLVGFDNTMKVEGLGTITFENEHKQKVPNAITYQRRI